MSTEYLRALCNAAGLAGSDAATAIRAYAAGGPLTAAEVAALRRDPAAVRAVKLTDRFGSDGARVAALVTGHEDDPVEQAMFELRRRSR